MNNKNKTKSDYKTIKKFYKTNRLIPLDIIRTTNNSTLNKMLNHLNYKTLCNPGSFLYSTKIPGKIINHRWILCISSVLPMINLLHGKSLTFNYLKLVELIARLVNRYGEPEALRRLKLYRLSIQQVVLDQCITPIPFEKRDLDGFPTIVRFLKPSNKRNLNHIRYVLSVIRVIDLFKISVNTNTDSITKPSTAVPHITQELLKFINKNKWLKTIKPYLKSRLILSNHAGPNGPATVTAPYDFTALMAPKNLKLLIAICTQLEVSEALTYPNDCSVREGNYIDSKIVFLQDKAGKTRQVAIADYWTNYALTNIHDTFMDALKNLNKDLTFNQDSIPERIRKLGTQLFSSDLTSFTDRFPRILGKAIVEIVYDKETAERWETMVSDRAFYVKENLNYVKYEVGTPMGLLSSWPVNTVAHHIVKQYCAYKLKRKGYKYLILGDDTIDSDIEVYNLYLQVIKQLGVEVSPSKCTVSKEGSCEFAKRLFLFKEEITGLPVNLLHNIEKHPEQFLELLRICRQRGYTDKILGPRFDLLLQIVPLKVRKVVADIFSLPEAISGQVPLKGVMSGSHAEAFTSVSEEAQKVYLELARDKIFWKEVSKIGLLPTRPNTCQAFEVGPLDPVNSAVLLKVLKYSQTDPSPKYFSEGATVPIDLAEYSIYYGWIKGDYRSLSKLPTSETYKYKNRGHRETKCKYEVLKMMLILLKTNNTHLFVEPNRKISNADLQKLVFIANGMTWIKKVIVQNDRDTTNTGPTYFHST